MNNTSIRFIEKIATDIEWLFSFKEVDENVSKKNELEKVKKLQEFFQNVNFSILQGEYLLEKTESILDKIHFEIVKPIEKDKQRIDKLNVSKVEYQNISDILFNYKKLVDVYKRNLYEDNYDSTKFYFINEISKIFKQTDIEDFSKKIREYRKNLDQTTDTDTENNLNYWLFKANVLLAEIDASLECSEKSLETLVHVYHSFKVVFESNKKNDIINSYTLHDILKDKCQYLLYKILKRLQIETVYDEEFHLLGLEKIERDDLKKQIKHYKFFLDLTINTYSKYRYKSTQDLNINTSKSDYTSVEVHLNSKLLYKLKNENFNWSNRINSIESLLSLVDNNLKVANEHDKYINRYNLIAYYNLVFLVRKNKLKIISNEIIDKIKNVKIKTEANIINEFKQLLIQLNNSFNQILEFINTAIKKDEIKRYVIKDYYHHLIYLKTLLSLIESFLKTQNYNSNFLQDGLVDYKGNGINLILNETTDFLIATIEKNIIECEASNYLPVYSFYQDSFIKIQDNQNQQNIDLFLDTSYVLPINFNSQKQTIKELKQLVVSLRWHYTQTEQFSITSQKVLKNWEGKFKEEYKNETKKANEELDKKVKEASISGIQIIGLFGGILAILIAFATIIPKVESFLLLIIYMLAYTFCILLFFVFLNVFVIPFAKKVSNFGVG